MIEQRIRSIFRGAASLLTRHAPESALASKPNTKAIRLPEDMHRDLLSFVGTNIRDESGFLRIREDGCKEGICVDVTYDARPNPWTAGVTLHGHLKANNKIDPHHWNATVVDGEEDKMGRWATEQEFLEILDGIRNRLVQGV